MLDLNYSQIKLIDTKQETIYKFDHVFSPETTNKKASILLKKVLFSPGRRGAVTIVGLENA